MLTRFFYILTSAHEGMLQMSIRAKLEAKLENVRRRAQVARENLRKIEDNLRKIEEEERDLESAQRVLAQIEDEEMAVIGSAGNGVDSTKKMSNRELILRILNNSERGMSPSEIRIAVRTERGRDIPAGSIHSALYHAKKAGRATNSDGLWTIAAPPDLRQSRPPRPPQPERPNPVERSDADADDSLI